MNIETDEQALTALEVIVMHLRDCGHKQMGETLMDVRIYVEREWKQRRVSV